ncbi:MAG: hypothetical protein WBF77_11605 [Sulfurimonadaceae bacterium]
MRILPNIGYYLYMKEIYGSVIMFFYFLKWPIFLGLPMLYYFYGLKNNYVMDALWVLCLVLIIKDFWRMFRG